MCATLSLPISHLVFSQVSLHNFLSFSVFTLDQPEFVSFLTTDTLNQIILWGFFCGLHLTDVCSTPPPSCKNQTCVQTLPNTLGGKITPISPENDCLRSTSTNNKVNKTILQSLGLGSIDNINIFSSTSVTQMYRPGKFT